MRDSIWGYAVIVLGVVAIFVILFLGSVTNTDQQNYTLLKETVEAAMLDSIDMAEYRKDGTIKLIEEKFVENFIRRFAENASLSDEYLIEIYDVNEEPPKVSLKVSSPKKTGALQNASAGAEIIEFKVSNNIDAILETKE